MKAILVFIAALIAAVSAQTTTAGTTCPAPVYTETLTPLCNNRLSIKLPNYEDQTSYYSCTTGKPLLQKCPSPTSFFTYVLQECTTCEEYIPPVACQYLSIQHTCVAIGVTTAKTTTTKTVTTPKTTTAASTTVSGSTTTSASTTTGITVPTPQTQGPTTTTVSSGIPLPNTPQQTNPPGGTTVPEPPTPLPTAPVIPDEPPSVPNA